MTQLPVVAMNALPVLTCQRGAPQLSEPERSPEEESGTFVKGYARFPPWTQIE